MPAAAGRAVEDDGGEGVGDSAGAAVELLARDAPVVVEELVVEELVGRVGGGGPGERSAPTGREGGWADADSARGTGAPGEVLGGVFV